MVSKPLAAAMVSACAVALIQSAVAQPASVQPPQGLSPAYRTCIERARSNTVQRGMCEQNELVSQDARLNKAYQEVMRQLARNPSRQVALRGEQRSWLRERDYSCKVDGQTLNSSCLVGKTATRANELERMIHF